MHVHDGCAPDHIYQGGVLEKRCPSIRDVAFVEASLFLRFTVEMQGVCRWMCCMADGIIAVCRHIPER